MQSPCQSLAQEFVVLTRARELLQSERTVLKNGTFDALPDLINEKARVISEITVLAHGRHEALTAICNNKTTVFQASHVNQRKASESAFRFRRSDFGRRLRVSV